MSDAAATARRVGANPRRRRRVATRVGVSAATAISALGLTAKFIWPARARIFTITVSDPMIRTLAVVVLVLAVVVLVLGAILLVLKIAFEFKGLCSYGKVATLAEDAGQKMIEKAAQSGELLSGLAALSRHMRSLRGWQETEDPPDEPL